MSTATLTRDEAAQVATTIKRQFGVMALATLGASDFMALGGETQPLGGLRFTARILPFTKSGRRAARPRCMFVTVTLNCRDLYDIKVQWLDRFTVVDHWEASDVYAEDLHRVALRLDYDGPEVVNPRY